MEEGGELESHHNFEGGDKKEYSKVDGDDKEDAKMVAMKTIEALGENEKSIRFDVREFNR